MKKLILLITLISVGALFAASFDKDHYAYRLSFMTDQELSNEYDDVSERVRNAPTIDPHDDTRMYALKAELVKRADLRKKMDDLKEKYYTQGLTDQEKKEVYQLI